VSFKFEQTKLSDVFDQINSRTQLNFSYSSDNIKLDELISLEVKDIKVEDLLNKIFEPRQIKWTLIGNQIALKKIRFLNISGKLSDLDNGEPIEYATVYLVGTNFNTNSNYKGEFDLQKIPAGDYTLSIKAFGFTPTNQVINLIDQPVKIDQKIPSQSIQLKETIIVSDNIIEKTSVSQMEISQTQIESGKGISNDPMKTINSLPGVASNNNMYGPSAIYVRGGEPYENLYLLDNIRLPFPFYFFGQSVINPDMLEKAEVLTGGWGANYGNAMSSVFNFSTRNGSMEKFKASADIGVFYMSALVETPIIKNKLSIIIGARKSNFDVLFSTVLPKPPKMGDITGKIAWNISEKNKLSFTSLNVQDRLNFLDSNIVINGLYANDRINAQNLQLQSVISNKAYSKLSVMHSGLDLNAYAGEFLLRINFNNYGLREDLSFYPNQKVKIRTGFEVNRDDEISHVKEIYNSTDINITDSTALYQERRVSKINHWAAAYGVYERTLLQRLKLSAGLRLEVNELNNRYDASPRLTLSYNLNSKSYISANWGLFTQSPGSYPCIQNPNLISNQCYHYILSYKYNFRPGLFARLETYYKDYKHLAMFDSTYTYSNNGKGSAKGFEFTLMKENGRFSGWLTYALSESERRRNLQTEVYPFFFDQRHTVNALISYRLKQKKRRWFVPTRYAFQFRYNTGAPYTPFVGADSTGGKFRFIAGSINSVRNPDYNNLNVKIQWHRTLGKKEKHGMVWYLDIWNLYSSKNVIGRLYEISKNGAISTKNNYTVSFIFNIGVKFSINQVFN
jgi:outer membrane receptor protein involved in Fe transport